MNSIKVKSDEVFKLIITDESGVEMYAGTYYFGSDTKITFERGVHEFTLEPITPSKLPQNKDEVS